MTEHWIGYAISIEHGKSVPYASTSAGRRVRLGTIERADVVTTRRDFDFTRVTLRLPPLFFAPALRLAGRDDLAPFPRRLVAALRGFALRAPPEGLRFDVEVRPRFVESPPQAIVAWAVAKRATGTR